MLLGASASIIILEIDKVMLNSYRLIQEVAYYGVAIYIATVVAMPYRAMYHISAPLTATYINQNQLEELQLLYRRSSLSLFTVAGGLFFLIMVNLEDLYGYLPEDFGGFYPVVFLVGIAKLTDSLSGTANSILFYSRYYTYMLVMGIGLAVMTISLNALLIPKYGALGCALATLISVLSYNGVKIVFIKKAFGFYPFSRHTLYNLLILGAFLLAGNFLPLPGDAEPWVRIFLRSLLLGVLFIGIHYRFKFSPEVHGMLRSYLKRKSHGPKEPRDSNN
jgi:O-antigen/teichoic acid export membrane protein